MSASKSVIDIYCFIKPLKYIVKCLKTGKKSLQIFGRDPEFRPEVRETENFTEAINISAIASGLEALNDFLHSSLKHKFSCFIKYTQDRVDIFYLYPIPSHQFFKEIFEYSGMVRIC